MIYELMPRNERKSFSGKAIVEETNGKQVLYSYFRPVLAIDETGEKHRLWDDWSLTTGTHIKSFCGLTKQEYLAIPYEPTYAI